jgi:hypothetical protein
MKKQRKFPQDVARFFNSPSSKFYPGTHQLEKMRHSSNIIVYNGGGTYVKSK